MARRTYTTPLLVGMLALTACPGDDVPADTEGTSTGDTTDDPTSVGPTTTPPTTTTVDPDSTTTVDPDSTSGGEVCEPVCGAGECCVGGFCFDEPAPTCEGGCGDFEACLCPEGSDPCDCVGECTVCGTDGTYDSCLDVECPAGSFCVVDDPDEPTLAWCAEQGCGTDDCACPLPDAATATPACGAFDGDEGNGSCFLDCSVADSTCPEGMICRTVEGESACVWPGEGIASNCCIAQSGTTGCDDPVCEAAVCGADAYCCDTEWDQICADAAPGLCPGVCPLVGDPQPQYGDCVNGENVCDVGFTCVSDAAGTFGWCTTLDCADDVVCQPPPATGDAPAVCGPINDMTDACLLDCSMAQTCPDGMTCFGGFACVWEQAQIGFGNCGLAGFECNTNEVCLDDGMPDPAWALCSEPGCASAVDCGSLPPLTGDAPVACGDPSGLGGADTCYLDCAAGQTCPDGMSCINDTGCAWPQGPVLFSDDFQTEDLSAGWTVNDVDGLTPDAGVAFVDDAWVVTDLFVAGEFVATSTSWYAPAGMSDDWLISPQIMLGPNTRLYWVSQTSNAGFPDTLEVRISTATNAIADFEANPALLVVDPEQDVPVAHFLDLAPTYMNQQVYIAFRNTSFDGELLAVDDVVVVDLP